MKDIEKKDLPEVSGGISVEDDEIFPQPRIDIPGERVWPLPEPMPTPIDR